jgi:hypothetical protein
VRSELRAKATWKRFFCGTDGKTDGRREMTKGYWVAFADVSDSEGHKLYMAENAKAFRRYGRRNLR